MLPFRFRFLRLQVIRHGHGFSLYGVFFNVEFFERAVKIAADDKGLGRIRACNLADTPRK